MADFASLLQSGEFADLHVTCNGAERHLHRAIICAQSSVFNTMCTGPFKESATRQIDLSDHSIEDFDRLISYFYTGDYQEEEDMSEIEKELAAAAELPAASSAQPNTTDPSCDDLHISKDTTTVLRPSKAITNINMYSIGDRYNVGALKELARKKFSAIDSADWLHELPTIAEQIYTTTPENDRGLRNILQKACISHAEIFMEDETISETALKVPQLALDICRSIWRHYRSELRHEQMEKNAAETKVAEQDVQIQRAMAEARVSRGKLERVVYFLNILDECRQCEEPFVAIVDPIREFANSPIFVRCSKCQTKHKAP